MFLCAHILYIWPMKKFLFPILIFQSEQLFEVLTSEEKK